MKPASPIIILVQIGGMAVFLAAILVMFLDYEVFQNVLAPYVIGLMVCVIFAAPMYWYWRKFIRQHSVNDDWKRHSCPNKPYEDDISRVGIAAEIEETADRLFETWRQHHSDAATVREERILLIGKPEGVGVITLQHDLLNRGYDLDICSDFDGAISSIIEQPTIWSYVFIDWDFLETRLSEREIFDDLFQLRLEAPAIPIGLISNSFTMDDFGTHRLNLADVSLQSPIDIDAISTTLCVMQGNNKLWQQRVKDRPSVSL